MRTEAVEAATIVDHAPRVIDVRTGNEMGESCGGTNCDNVKRDRRGGPCRR